MGFGGGAGSTYIPAVETPEKVQTTKSVTEAATSARDSQKDKASKAAGIQGSILTSPLINSTTSGNSLLGQ